MSLQARLSADDDRLYSADRDLAHCFPQVMRLAAGRLEDELWGELHAYLKMRGVDQDDLGDACRSLILFVSSATQLKDESMRDALVRVGWHDLPQPAQVAVMATVGTVVSGYFFAGARDATMGGKGPCTGLEYLLAEGNRAAKLIAMPRWRRKWHKWRYRLVGVLRALRSTASADD